jgi:hypothetical protein
MISRNATTGNKPTAEIATKSQRPLTVGHRTECCA